MSLGADQIIQLCKDMSVASPSFPLNRVRDVVCSVVGKMHESVDRHYFEQPAGATPGGAPVLYKDLVEILVRIGFSKCVALSHSRHLLFLFR